MTSYEEGYSAYQMVPGIVSYAGKMFGCTRISKLRAILLMEADFNFANKMIYGVQMLDNARFHGIMME